MAARLRPRHQDEIREKIRASQLVNALENHVLGTKVNGETVAHDMSASQITAALGLLKKCVPDLAVTQLTGPDEGPLTVIVQQYAKHPASK